MTNLIVVSNRLPFKIVNDKLVKSSGGLASSIKNITIKYKWIGWLNVNKNIKLDNNIIPISLDNNQINKYYNNFCNNYLWYIFHSNFNRYFTDDDYNVYKNVNKLFASKINESIVSKNDIIFINDFHLILVGFYLKSIYNLKNKIMYFHHIPIPSNTNKFNRIIPNDFIDKFKYYDLISFHTNNYINNFNKIVNNSFSTNLLLNPIGINYNKLHNLSLRTNIVNSKEKIIILGIDRLDFIKGLENKFESIKIFLKKYPEFIGKIQLFQLIIPSREIINKKLKYDLEIKISKINGMFTTFDSIPPIKYQYGTVSQEMLVKIYMKSNICLITSLNDGMNLVSLEYLTCNPNGVLCLSNKTGSSNYLKCIKFNPKDPNQIADSIRKAINYKPNNLLNINFIKQNSSNFWISKMINNLKKNLLFLDYDGTLVNIFKNPDYASPTKKQFLLLDKLISNKNNLVFIISGRSKKIINNWFGSIKNLGLSAEHGSFIKYPNCIWFGTDYSNKINNLYKKIKDSIDLKNVIVENKKTSLNFNFNFIQNSSYIKDKIKNIITSNNITCKIIEDINYIEVLFSNKDKGFIVNQILNNYKFIKNVYAFGDEKTDEDMFKVLNKKNHYTFKVGNGKTFAKYRCLDVEDVYNKLNLINDNKLILQKRNISRKLFI